jgi:hypothetical protein
VPPTSAAWTRSPPPAGTWRRIARPGRGCLCALGIASGSEAFALSLDRYGQPRPPQAHSLPGFGGPLKYCRRTGHQGSNPLPLSAFGLDRREPDGRRPVCRDCRRQPQREALHRYRQRHRKPGGGLAVVWSLARAQVFAHYGESCACCGSVDQLCIDHIAGGGSKHRAELGLPGGKRFYAWLALSGFPPGYQVLCKPCNDNKSSGARCPLEHAAD